MLAAAETFPPITDLLVVISAIATVIGATIGLLLPGEGRRIAENVVLGAGVGAVIGTAVALAIGGGVALGKALP